MNIRCNRSEFCEAVSVVSRVVSSRSSLPALEGILLRTVSDGLELLGYDLDTGISTRIDAQLTEGGEIVLPAKVLLDIARRMPGDTVSLKSGDKCLTELKSGAAEYTILGMPADEFPEFPALGDAACVSLPQNVLRSMIDQTLFAVSQSDSKPVHTGSLFELSEEGLVTVVSVDGYRLALRREQAKIEKGLRFVVPGRTLSEVLRILGDVDDMAGLMVSRKHIVIHIGGYRVLSRLLEGDFLDYKTAIPKSGTVRVRVNTRDFMDSIERASLLISDRVKSPLRVRFERDEISLTCSTALGRAFDKLAAATEGEPLEMGFNNRYLLDALRNADCDEVSLEISGPLSPMKILPITGDSFLFLVLPVRLKAD